MNLVVVVNENDEIVGHRKRGTLLPGELHRACGLWLTNSRGEILMAQRAHIKRTHAGKWGPAVVGTVDWGDDYDKTIVKEIREEIGIIVDCGSLVPGPKMHVQGCSHGFFIQWYRYTLDKPAEEFVLQEEEVAQVMWYAPEQLKHEITTAPEKFSPSTPHWAYELMRLDMSTPHCISTNCDHLARKVV